LPSRILPRCSKNRTLVVTRGSPWAAKRAFEQGYCAHCRLH
jgi:hypothetical protein